MSFALYFDENIHPEVASWLRGVGHDAVTAHDVGLSGRSVPDDVHLRYAAKHGRVLVSHDLKTLSTAAQQWLDRGREHPGIVLCNFRPSSELYKRLCILLEEYDPAALRNAVVWLPPKPEP